MKNIFVSFITPMANANRYLEEYLRSFMKLPNDKYEIILVFNHGHEDPSVILEKYKNLLPLKLAHTHTNVSIGLARNAGLKKLSPNSTHVMYVNIDDRIATNTFFDKIFADRITWFNHMSFDRKNERYVNRNALMGKNNFSNDLWGVAIPKDIAIENVFEANHYSDMLINRRLVAKYKNTIVTSRVPAVAHRLRTINCLKPSLEAFKELICESQKMIAENLNSYYFNMKQVHMHYWMWKPHLKSFNKELLPKTKWRHQFRFWLMGCTIRVLRLEDFIFNPGKKIMYE